MRLIDADKLRGHKPFTIRGGQIGDYYEGYIDCAMEADEAVQNAPTVEAVPVVHGRWIVDSASGKIACSNCGCIFLGYNGRCHPNYCPQCGAKMDLEDE